MQTNIFYHQKGKDEMYKIWHSSEKSMLIYMHSDGGNIVFNDKIYPIKRGALCFVGAGKYHYTMPHNVSEYERSKIFFENDNLIRLMGAVKDSGFGKIFFLPSAVYAQIPIRYQKDVEAIFLDACNNSGLINGREMILYSCILRLFAYLFNFMNKTEFVPENEITKAIEYINTHISEQITIDDICDVIHMSKYYFCRKFKSITGTTVMNYILKTRLVLAKEMLLCKDYSVTQITEKCGFGSISYFCRIFKENTGYTALQYKNAQMEKHKET